MENGKNESSIWDSKENILNKEVIESLVFRIDDLRKEISLLRIENSEYWEMTTKWLNMSIEELELVKSDFVKRLAFEKAKFIRDLIQMKTK